MAKLVFSTVGSLGDLFPSIPVAHELQRRGHDVVFAVPPIFRTHVRGEGFDYVPVRPALGIRDFAEEPGILSRRRRGLDGFALLVERFYLPPLAESVDDLAGALDGADLLVAHPLQLAAPIASSVVGVPWSSVSNFAHCIPSAWYAPQLLPDRVTGRTANRVGWALMRRALRRFDAPINAVRRRYGLPATKDAILVAGTSDEQTVVLSSPHFTPAAPDWASTVHLSGFTNWDRPQRWAPSDGLRRFLDGGPAPVVVTVGASLSVDPGDSFFARAAEEIARRRLRAVFLGLTLRRSDAERFGPAIGAWGYVPLSYVLPRASAVVHHAGFNTTAAALLHGTPQVVVPRAFDQFGNARRVAELGLGRAVDFEHLDRLGAAIAAVARADGEERAAASAMAERLRPENGTARAADLLERRLPVRRVADTTAVAVRTW